MAQMPHTLILAWRRGVGIGIAILACFALPIRGTSADEPRYRLLGPLGASPADAPASGEAEDSLKRFSLAQRDPLTPPLSLGVKPLSYPEWLKRVELGVGHGSEKPRYHIETVQPLYQSRDQTYTLFVQPRLSARDADLTANLGLGYRQLFFDQQFLGGINAFYDYTDRHNHYRLGLGGEAFSRYLEARANGYFGLSGRRTVGEDANQEVFERALTGMDVEAGGPVPYLPFLKLFGSYAYYDFKHDIDSHIGKVRAEVKPLRFLRLDLEAFNDNKAPWEYRIGVVLTFDLERGDLLAKPSAEAYPHKDMRHMTLHRVVRDHEIKVERFAKTKGGAGGGVTVAVRRGT